MLLPDSALRLLKKERRVLLVRQRKKVSKIRTTWLGAKDSTTGRNMDGIWTQYVRYWYVYIPWPLSFNFSSSCKFSILAFLPINTEFQDRTDGRFFFTGSWPRVKILLLDAVTPDSGSCTTIAFKYYLVAFQNDYARCCFCVKVSSLFDLVSLFSRFKTKLTEMSTWLKWRSTSYLAMFINALLYMKSVLSPIAKAYAFRILLREFEKLWPTETAQF